MARSLILVHLAHNFFGLNAMAAKLCKEQQISFSNIRGGAEIRNFSASVEKYFTSERSEQVKYSQHEKRNLVSPSGHVMFYLLYKH